MSSAKIELYSVRGDAGAGGCCGNLYGIDRTKPAVLNDYMNDNDWQTFCDDVDKAMEPMNRIRKFMMIGCLLTLPSFLIVFVVAAINPVAAVAFVVFAPFVFIFTIIGLACYASGISGRIQADIQQVCSKTSEKQSQLSFHVRFEYSYYSRDYYSTYYNNYYNNNGWYSSRDWRYNSGYYNNNPYYNRGYYNNTVTTRVAHQYIEVIINNHNNQLPESPLPPTGVPTVTGIPTLPPTGVPTIKGIPVVSAISTTTDETLPVATATSIIATAPPTTTTSSSSGTAERLAELEQLRPVLSDKEYERKRALILAAL